MANAAEDPKPFCLRRASAYWLRRDCFAWAVAPDSRVRLHFSATAALDVTVSGLVGDGSIELFGNGRVDGPLAECYPHLAGLPLFWFSAVDTDLVAQLIRHQLALSATDRNDCLQDATAVQMAGVLDDLFRFDGTLGPELVDLDGGRCPRLRVWAPTARKVRLYLFDDSHSVTPALVREMARNPATGTWHIDVEPHWNRKFYLYEVEVFVRQSGRIEQNLVTDPYSLSLSVDSGRSQIVALEDPDLLPADWHQLRKPPLHSPLDMSVYELHVRDFSASDDTVPEHLRGKFAAFSLATSRGMQHLRRLAEAGLSHVQLLPVADCCSIPEHPLDQLRVDEDLSCFGPSSPVPQEKLAAVRRRDAFNWGYDPFHYCVPEGGYAVDADGVSRILEFRQLVAGLNRSGLRLVIDMVYNHTGASGQERKSVLDRIVPDYYHRLDSSGNIESSACCNNTASEHYMMEKLMLDSLRLWATAYKVDGFRFDLMGHHSRATLIRARDLLQALTPARDGVDGASLCLYGEGWNFGEVANNARFHQATQANMAGTGIGTFNDRLRDALRGGGPFDSGADLVRRQGFVNGLYHDANEANSGSGDELAELLALGDRIKLGLAGCLADYCLTDCRGRQVHGAELGGYTCLPQEAINYVEAHDNETLFDLNQYRLPLRTSAQERLRAHNLATSLVVLAQGIPFIHAGQDMLRSKSMDRNSYDSGDWFNLLDFSYRQNGWGRGLPPRDDNGLNWPVCAPRLADPGLAVTPAEILAAGRHLREMLEIRRHSPLFRLRSGAEIRRQLRFHNTGPRQIPGLIVMTLADAGTEAIQLVVLFNATAREQIFALAGLKGRHFRLHPVQRLSADPTVRQSLYHVQTGDFSVPARTTAVFSRNPASGC